MVGHYPCSEADDHAQLRTRGTVATFRDDALTELVLRAYRHFAGDASLAHTRALGGDVVRLLDAAKQACR